MSVMLQRSCGSLRVASRSDAKQGRFAVWQNKMMWLDLLQNARISYCYATLHLASATTTPTMTARILQASIGGCVRHDARQAFTFLELPKFTKNIDELSNIVEKWAYFFQYTVSE